MHPREHDIVCALISHLPHLVSNAFCLGTAFLNTEYEAVTGPSFKDMTRVAGSSPEIWKDIFFTNRDNILEALGHFRHHLDLLTRALRDNDEQTLVELLNQAKKIKDVFKNTGH